MDFLSCKRAQRRVSAGILETRLQVFPTDRLIGELDSLPHLSFPAQAPHGIHQKGKCLVLVEFMHTKDVCSGKKEGAEETVNKASPVQ